MTSRLRRKLITNATRSDYWNDDLIQFPRLLAEIRAAGLTNEQYGELSLSMDLTRKQIDSLFSRAQAMWEKIKLATCPIQS